MKRFKKGDRVRNDDLGTGTVTLVDRRTTLVFVKFDDAVDAEFAVVCRPKVLEKVKG